MKKRLALLFIMIMVLTCMPVMAVTVPDGGAVTAAATKSTSSSKTGWRKKGSRYRYYYTSKKYYKGKLKMINGYVYAFDKNGYVQKGWVTYNNKKFYASTNTGAAPVKYGALLTGYRKIGGYYYYLNPKGGAMMTGVVNIGKGLAYFNPSTGRQNLTTGAKVSANGVLYQVQAGGLLKKIGKAPAATTTAASGADVYGMDKKAQKYSSRTKYLILVNKSKHNINIYKGSKNKWVCIRRNIKCTIGKKSTPSPSGSWTVNHKTHKKHGYKDFSASTAFYATRISAGNYFHSILYKKGSRNPATARVKDGALGKSKSNSCIRLPLADAKFIYQGVPVGSKIIVY